MRRLGESALAATLVLVLSGCPITDDYFIDAHAGLGGSSGEAGSEATTAGTDAKPEGGSDVGGSSAIAGSGAVAETGGVDATGGSEPVGDLGGSPDMPSGGSAGSAGSAGSEGCTGFALAGRPDHDYLLCTGTPRDYQRAQEACMAQDMRLAWLESSTENEEVSSKVDAISQEVEVLIGANDIANEGKWFWDGGAQFWEGTNYGKPVSGRFSAWAQGTPNNGNGNEDCGVLSSGTATWGDRNCTGKYAYLCEAQP
jgi:hypothetical protein